MMEFLIHIAVTAVALVVVSKLLRGFEVDNLFTALVAALIIGVIHTLAAPLAVHVGRWVGGLMAQLQMAHAANLILLFLTMLAINALVLKAASAVGPGFRIAGFGTAMLGALILALINGLVGELISMAK